MGFRGLGVGHSGGRTATPDTHPVEIGLGPQKMAECCRMDTPVASAQLDRFCLLLVPDGSRLPVTLSGVFQFPADGDRIEDVPILVVLLQFPPDQVLSAGNESFKLFDQVARMFDLWPMLTISQTPPDSAWVVRRHGEDLFVQRPSAMAEGEHVLVDGINNVIPRWWIAAEKSNWQARLHVTSSAHMPEEFQNGDALDPTRFFQAMEKASQAGDLYGATIKVEPRQQ